MNKPTTAREIWHTARRATTVARFLPVDTYREEARWSVYRRTAYSDVPRVPVARGQAGLRDELVRYRMAYLSERPAVTGHASLVRRLHNHLACIYTAEVARRGGETTIELESGTARLKVTDHRPGLTLLRAEGWRYYSRRFGSRPATLAYLCGRDDNGLWATRVAGTCETIRAALDWLEPAEVKCARQAGRRVRRQGDVYAVEVSRDRADVSAVDLPVSHEWRPKTRFLVHRPAEGERRHRPLRVTWPCKFVRQRRFAATGRSRTSD